MVLGKKKKKFYGLWYDDATVEMLMKSPQERPIFGSGQECRLAAANLRACQNQGNPKKNRPPVKRGSVVARKRAK